MAIRSGIGAQLGVGNETSYGTYQAPTTFVEFTSESLALTQEYIRTAGLRAGRLSQSENLHVATTRQAAGSVSFDVTDKGLGKFLNLLHGNTVNPASLTGGLYRQSHVIGTSDPDGKSLTTQIGRPDLGGTVRAFSYLGCKVAEATFTLERGSVVTTQFSLDAQDETTSESLASATYAADSVPFNFLGAEIEFDDVVLTDCVRSATITIALPMATDRFCIGSGAVKKEPVINGQVAVTATLDMEFSSLTQHTAFKNATRRKLELLCEGTTTSGTYTSALNFTLPTTVTTESAPVVDGPDILTQSLTLEALDDGTNAPLTVEYISSDSTL